MPPADSQPGEARTYRRTSGIPRLHAFDVRVEETDLRVQASVDLRRECRDLVIGARAQLSAYIEAHPGFLDAKSPWHLTLPGPSIVRLMAAASVAAGVGPMAAVAGAIAETVGTAMLASCEEVVVENGGDIFLSTQSNTVVGLYAGGLPLSMKIGLRLPGDAGPMGICTSSASVGHSLSFGKADAACVVSPSAALADAVATAVANRVVRTADIPAAIEWGRRIPQVQGLVVIKGDQIGMWGGLEVIPLKGKRG